MAEFWGDQPVPYNKPLIPQKVQKVIAFMILSPFLIPFAAVCVVVGIVVLPVIWACKTLDDSL